MSKNPDAIDPEEAAKVARDIKSVLSQKEKVIFLPKYGICYFISFYSNARFR